MVHAERNKQVIVDDIDLRSENGGGPVERSDRPNRPSLFEIAGIAIERLAGEFHELVGYYSHFCFALSVT